MDNTKSRLPYTPVNAMLVALEYHSLDKRPATKPYRYQSDRRVSYLEMGRIASAYRARCAEEDAR
jgi:hypothetical protein